VIKLRIDADHYPLDDKLRDQIEQRIGSLDRHLPKLAEGHVTVSWDDHKEKTAIRAQVWGGKDQFEASRAARAATEAVNQVGEALETQVRREHSEETGHYDHDGHPKE
jgi:ribosome-associated translation inhibitor RaiA